MGINELFLGQAIGLNQLVGGFIVYLYLGYTCMVLASRLHVQYAWLAWIPVANLYLLTTMAAKEWWWIFGFFIPFVNFGVIAYLWSEIGKRFNKPWWIGALIIIPFAGLLVPGYLVIITGNHGTPKTVDPI